MTKRADGRRVHDLYNDLQPQLVRILVSNLQAPEWIVDDACQSAWSSLLEHGGAVAAGGELGWLSTTATRAALRLLRRERSAECGEEPPPLASLDALRVPEPGPVRSFELRERLAEVKRLRLRVRRDCGRDRREPAHDRASADAGPPAAAAGGRTVSCGDQLDCRRPSQTAFAPRSPTW
jgi:DNA-directed RNA polymerase specialized sigma24 family protein